MNKKTCETKLAYSNIGKFHAKALQLRLCIHANFQIKLNAHRYSIKIARGVFTSNCMFTDKEEIDVENNVLISFYSFQIVHFQNSKFELSLKCGHDNTGEVFLDGVLQVPGQVGGQNLGEKYSSI